ncbi:MAG: ABC transporter permease, partial [Lachnospiraceae bacterium]|nr:ABC transporter permease [Lachnospiraceae bacterium]
MRTMKDLEKKLRKSDYHQARLYLFCNFISLLLITAYSIMMLSPTVLEVFPEGGDSRKQVQMIFVLAVVGCTAFTL